MKAIFKGGQDSHKVVGPMMMMIKSHMKLLTLEILGFHDGEHETDSLQGYCVLLSRRSRPILHPSGSP
jgi:hypothetical protein